MKRTSLMSFLWTLCEYMDYHNEDVTSHESRHFSLMFGLFGFYRL
jgi:hypothetical protein